MSQSAENGLPVDSHPRRTAAVESLRAKGEPVVHAAMAATVGHGHGGLCCCLMQLCRSDACTINAEIVRQLDAPIPPATT